ncbi:hypothetical protein EDEG_04207, partial [Edhazardia aedis USNM 41457]
MMSNEQNFSFLNVNESVSASSTNNMATPENRMNLNRAASNFNMMQPIPMLPHKQFSGTNGESIEDWIRLFKPFLLFYKNENRCILHSYAVSLLIGEAGKFYDNLRSEPDSWEDFVDIMLKRYGKSKKQRPVLMR